MRSIARGIGVSTLCVAAWFAVASASPASGMRDDDSERTRIIAVQYKVFDRSGHQRGNTAGVGESAAVRVGETVRIELVGTAIINGIGEEVPIDADFNVAAGRGNIQLGNAGDNWVNVAVRSADGDGTAQVGFSVTTDYDMHGRNTSGRITLEIEGSGGSRDDDSSDSSAEDLTDALYRSIANTRAADQDVEADVEHIRENGYRGAVEVAASLAEEAESDGRGRSERERGYEAEDIRRVGSLYRGLLKRQQSDQELWNEDRGFVNNVRALHEHGFESLVQTIVGSQEFREAWGFTGRRR